MQTVHVSNDRQIVIPKTICDIYHLTSGQELEIELTSQGILLKTKTALPKISIDDVAGCLAYKGKAKTLEEMDKAIEEAVIAKWGQNDCYRKIICHYKDEIT